MGTIAGYIFVLYIILCLCYDDDYCMAMTIEIDRWMDGWMDERMVGWMDGWMDG